MSLFVRATKGPFRLVTAVWGKEKIGKTSFGLTLPGPIRVVNLDRPLGSLVGKYPDKEIYEARVQLGDDDLVAQDAGVPSASPEDVAKARAMARMRNAVANQLNPANYSKMLNLFLESYEEAILMAPTGTVIVDTFTQVRQIIDAVKLDEVRERRSKKTGKDSDEVKVFPFDYAECNLVTSNIVRRAYSTQEINFVFVHRAAAVYDAGGNETGGIKMQGWREIPAAVEITMHLYREGEKFMGKIESCGQNPKLVGLTLQNPDYAQLKGLLE